MQNIPKILLPHGTRFVTTSDIPALIATALNPEPVGESRQVTNLVKTAKATASPEEAHWDGWPIDEDDRKTLNKIWGEENLPPLMYPVWDKSDTHIAVEIWKPYADAFLKHGQHLHWILDVTVSNTHTKAWVLRVGAQKNHHKLLRAEIERGCLRQLNPADNIAVTSYLDYGRVTIEDFVNYVRNFLVEVRFISLRSLIEPYVEKSLSELPDEIRVGMKATNFLKGWDSSTPVQRLEVAEQYDGQHDTLPVGTSSVRHKKEPKIKVPDWEFWRAMRKTEDWQACALSLNIDPDSMTHHPQSWMAGSGSGAFFTTDSFPSNDVKANFEKRLRLLGANRFDQAIFTLPMAKNSNLGPDEVLLSEFLVWGLSVGWDDMPPELIAIAQPKEPPQTAPNASLTSALLSVAMSTVKVGPADKNSGVTVSNSKTKNKWDSHALKRLLEESREVGMTHEKLAQKYNVKRPLIGRMLQKARDTFLPKKASSYDVLPGFKKAK